MTSHKLTPLRTDLLIAAFTAIWGTSVLYGQVVVDNLEHRPLVGLLDSMEKSLGVAVNYEDVPYENSADLEDVSTPQQRAAYPGYRLLVPRKGRLSTTLSLGADTTTNLNLLLASYRNNHMPGDFGIEQANGMLYVVATKVLAANGMIRDVTSPMKTAITVPYAQRTVGDTVGLILESIFSATHTKIAAGSLPFLPTETVNFGAADTPARDALASLFTKVSKGSFSYRLLFDPLSGYMLNIQAVPSAGSSSTGLSPAPQQPNQSPPGRPGFTKQ